METIYVYIMILVPIILPAFFLGHYLGWGFNLKKKDED
jgi:hypothetical protein